MTAAVVAGGDGVEALEGLFEGGGRFDSGAAFELGID